MASSVRGLEDDEARRGSFGWSVARVGGLAGLAFASTVVLQNAVLLAGNPLPNAALSEIESFYRDAPARIGIAVALVATNIAFLLTFGHIVAHRIEEASAGRPVQAGARVAARVGAVGTVLLGGAFMVTTFLQAVLTARIEEIVVAGQLQLMWDLHGAAFAMSATSLAVVLGAFSVGALLVGAVVPRWVGMLGLAGAASLLIAGALVVPTLEGGWWFGFQLGGFAAWVVFILAASLRMLRGRAG